MIYNLNVNNNPNPQDIYNYIYQQFITIKNSNSFNTYTLIPPSDLILISNIIMECVDKMGDLSSLYINKLNNSQISNINISHLNKIITLHDELFKQIYNFNNISCDILNGLKEINDKKFNQDTIYCVYYDIINRYKLIIYQIFNLIKSLITHIILIKDII
jgi:hypothetical protein